MAFRTRHYTADSLKKDQKKRGIRQNLEQYYADDMVEEVDNTAPPITSQQKRDIIPEEKEEEPEDNIDLDDAQAKEKLYKEHMDRISDILVNLIFKNVTLFSDQQVTWFRK